MGEHTPIHVYPYPMQGPYFSRSRSVLACGWFSQSVPIHSPCLLAVRTHSQSVPRSQSVFTRCPCSMLGRFSGVKEHCTVPTYLVNESVVMTAWSNGPLIWAERNGVKMQVCGKSTKVPFTMWDASHCKINSAMTVHGHEHFFLLAACL